FRPDQGRTLVLRIEMRLSPSVEQMHAQVGFTVFARLFSVHVETIGTAVDLRDSDLHQGDKPLIEPASLQVLLNAKQSRDPLWDRRERIQSLGHDMLSLVSGLRSSNTWERRSIWISSRFSAESPALGLQASRVARSFLKMIADVDRAGVRIGVARGSAYDLYLTRTVKNATLVRYPTASLAVPGFIADKLEVVAGVRQPLALFAKTNPDVR